MSYLKRINKGLRNLLKEAWGKNWTDEDGISKHKLSLNDVGSRFQWEVIPQGSHYWFTLNVTLIEGWIDVGKKMVSERNRFLNMVAHILSKSPWLSSLWVQMRMSSEEWHQRSNLISSQHKFVIRRVVEKPWNIWSNESQSTYTRLK